MSVSVEQCFFVGIVVPGLSWIEIAVNEGTPETLIFDMLPSLCLVDACRGCVGCDTGSECV